MPNKIKAPFKKVKPIDPMSAINENSSQTKFKDICITQQATLSVFSNAHFEETGFLFEFSPSPNPFPMCRF